jgi:hypothetical protein
MPPGSPRTVPPAADSTETYAIQRTPRDPYQQTQTVYRGAEDPGGEGAVPPHGAVGWGDEVSPVGQQSASPTQPGQYPQYGGYQDPGQYPQPAFSAAPQYPPPTQYLQPPQYPQPGFPEPGTAPLPPAPGPGPRRPGQRRTAAVVAGAVAVVLVAGGGAVAAVLALSHHGSTSSSPPPTSQPASTLPTTAATTPAQSPTPSSTPSPTPSPTATGPIAFAAGVSSAPHAQQVESLFTAYFDGINTHNFTEYSSALAPAMQAKNPQSSFDSGYATTMDSNETINSITPSGSGLTAVITFTSRQAPADSPDKSACNNWTLTLPLVPQGSGYVITVPPQGYASMTDC